ncbi:hypothetical protein E2C01_051171 [Portunus trituberculatus]|uniref:Uncharacterized protein n=1 Tax=Portunus trituberculatus TaxID=210409 RepID=A0A5B7GHW7_PORTR|nr:hypothetical protein [Portunus trituberculatus]
MQEIQRQVLYACVSGPAMAQPHRITAPQRYRPQCVEQWDHHVPLLSSYVYLYLRMDAILFSFLKGTQFQPNINKTQLMANIIPSQVNNKKTTDSIH